MDHYAGTAEKVWIAANGGGELRSNYDPDIEGAEIARQAAAELRAVLNKHYGSHPKVDEALDLIELSIQDDVEPVVRVLANEVPA